jgi:glutamate synthase domain-containing protein 3
MELAKMESTKYKEENEELEKKIKELSEALSVAETKNKKILKIVEKLDSSLNETLLSNAKLLYCNRTLSDASLNERQKHKIVEAIAKAKTPEEAKNLQEALKATVGTTKKDGPQSLSESVQRRSNLSGIMPRRKEPVQELSFSDRMKKLAGIE